MEFFDPNVSVNLQVNPTGRYNAVKVLSNQDNNGMGSDAGPGTIALNLYGNLDMNGYNIINAGGETADAVTSVIWRNTGAPPATGVIVGDSTALSDYLAENPNCNVVYCDSESIGGNLVVDSVLSLNNTVRLIGYDLKTNSGASIIFTGVGAILNAASIEDINLTGVSNTDPFLLYDSTISNIEGILKRVNISTGVDTVPQIQINGTNTVNLILDTVEIVPNISTNTVYLSAGSTLIIECTGYGGFFNGTLNAHIFGPADSGTVNISNTTMTMPIVVQDATVVMVGMDPNQIPASDSVGFVTGSNTPNTQFFSAEDFIKKLANVQSCIYQSWNNNAGPQTPYAVNTPQVPSNGLATVTTRVFPTQGFIQPQIGTNYLNFVKNTNSPPAPSGLYCLINWQLDLSSSSTAILTMMPSVAGGGATIINTVSQQVVAGTRTLITGQILVSDWTGNVLLLTLNSDTASNIGIIGCSVFIKVLNY